MVRVTGVGYQKAGLLSVAKQQGVFERRLKPLGIEAVKWSEFEPRAPSNHDRPSAPAQGPRATQQTGRQAMVSSANLSNHHRATMGRWWRTY